MEICYALSFSYPFSNLDDSVCFIIAAVSILQFMLCVFARDSHVVCVGTSGCTIYCIVSVLIHLIVFMIYQRHLIRYHNHANWNIIS